MLATEPSAMGIGTPYAAIPRAGARSSRVTSWSSPRIQAAASPVSPEPTTAIFLRCKGEAEAAIGSNFRAHVTSFEALCEQRKRQATRLRSCHKSAYRAECLRKTPHLN